MKKINKEELHNIFKGIAEGNEIYFNKFYEEYNRLIYGIAFSILKNNENAEEIVQKVSIKIWNLEKDKLPKKYESTWLYTLTKNETLNYLKTVKLEQNLEEVYYFKDEDKELDTIIDKDSYNRIISRLDLQEQEIVSLKILSNFSFNQISQILNIPIGTVKWKYYKSIHTLKLLLTNFAMFIITFAIGIKSVFTMQRKQSTMETQEKEDIEILDNKLTQDTSIVESAENGQLNRVEEDSTTTDAITVEESSANVLEYYTIGIFSVSAIFLILTIIFSIFFTKYQLKAKKKMSK